MSSKLDKIRDKKSESYYYGNAAPVNYGGDESNAWEAGASNGYVDGWNDALNLNLTEKFVEYLHEFYIMESGNWWRNKATRENQLASGIYKYWIENIYKP